MSVRSGQAITAEFITSSPSTGAAANADSTPTAVLVVNGVDNGATVTVSNVDTGRYKAAVTLPTLAIGDVVELLVSATVSSVAGKAIVWRDTKDVLLDASGKTTDAVQTGDSFARIGADGAGLTALGDARLANLDASVNSRLASSAYTAPPSAVSIRMEIDANSAGLAAIYTDTHTTLPGTLAAVKVKTDALPSNPAAASDVPPAHAVASAVRAELATELGRLDQAVSTRQATFTAATSISFPTNFGSLAITGGGAVTAGTVGDKSGYALTSAYDFATGTAAVAESYAANGAAPTPVQALLAIHQMLMGFTISGTTYTVKKLDGSTAAFVVTLDDATNPTGAARA